MLNDLCMNFMDKNKQSLLECSLVLSLLQLLYSSAGAAEGSPKIYSPLLNCTSGACCCCCCGLIISPVAAADTVVAAAAASVG